MRDDIFYYLKSVDFNSIEVNLDYLKLLYKEVEGYNYIINLVYLDKENSIDKLQYSNILDKIKTTFTPKYGDRIRILSIFLSEYIDLGKSLIDDSYMYWIVDEKNLKLIIYEEQPMDFLAIKSGIERILDRKKHIFEYKIEDLRKEYNVSSTAFQTMRKYISSLTLWIVVANILVYFLFNTGFVLGDKRAHLEWGGLNWLSMMYDHQYYRGFTYMFLHFNMNHLINNMILLLCLGEMLERAIGKVKFISIYLFSGMFSGLCSILFHIMREEYVLTCGASGAIFAIIGAIAYIVFIRKDSKIKISSSRMLLFVFLVVYNSFLGVDVDNVGHISGLIIGFILGCLFYHTGNKKKGTRV